MFLFRMWARCAHFDDLNRDMKRGACCPSHTSLGIGAEHVLPDVANNVYWDDRSKARHTGRTSAVNVPKPKKVLAFLASTVPAMLYKETTADRQHP